MLAGGFGTRLRSVVSQVPKPMAPVAGRPFLDYLLGRLDRQGFDHIVLATGYKHQVVSEYFGDAYGKAALSYAVEHTPLGTGGAIVNALQQCDSDWVTVLNGDTLFDIDHKLFIRQAEVSGCRLALSARQVPDAGRYGAVVVDAQGRVVRFEEKSADREAVAGLINGGIYRLHRSVFDGKRVGEAFSFERDILQPLAVPVFAMPTDAYFIDIGIPSDYARAQEELPHL